MSGSRGSTRVQIKAALMTGGSRVNLPGTGLSVSRLCLGGNRFGGELDEAASFALLDAFAEAGGNFIDTAHVYADWIPGNPPSSSEKTIGRWLNSRKPQGIVVATKGGHPRLAAPAARRLDALSLRQDVEDSLSNLGLDSLDLFFLHRDDPARPAEDILGTLETLRQEGLLRHYGASNWPANRLAAAERAASEHGWRGFAASQAEWSLAQRNPGTMAGDLHSMDRDMLDLHRRTRLTAIPYSAQAKGYFDKLGPGLDPAAARLYDNPANRAMAGTLALLAGREAATLTQVMLAAMMRAPFAVIPVIGCRTPEQVISSFGSLRISLSQIEADELLEQTRHTG